MTFLDPMIYVIAQKGQLLPLSLTMYGKITTSTSSHACVCVRACVRAYVCVCGGPHTCMHACTHTHTQRYTILYLCTHTNNKVDQITPGLVQ